MKNQNKFLGIILIFSIIPVSALLYQNVVAQTVPEWVKNTALWYGEGTISESEFLNAIKFLIENQIIVLDVKMEVFEAGVIVPTTANVVIPNGNSELANVGFYIPLNLEIQKGTTVVWINEDVVGHTIQSQDGQGNIMSLFNSNVLNTGERFAYKFEEEGGYNYFCTLHPWRVGVITVK